MKYLRIKLDDREGYLKAFENQKKGSNDNAPDFKGDGVAVWANEGASVELANEAAEAGACDPVPTSE